LVREGDCASCWPTGAVAQETAQGIVQGRKQCDEQRAAPGDGERGIDARSCAFECLWVARPDACRRVARLLGIRKVIVPGHSSALSALGCVSSRHQLHAAPVDLSEQRQLGQGEPRPNPRGHHRLRSAGFWEASDEAPEFRWIRCCPLSRPELCGRTAAAGPRFPIRSRRPLSRTSLAALRFATDEPWEVVRAAVDSDGAEADSARRRAWCRCDGGRLREAATVDAAVLFCGSAPADTAENERTRLAQGRTITGPALISDSMSTLVLPPHSRATVLNRGILTSIPG